jgi:formate dehydrogenase iron-sulfur subunit
MSATRYETVKRSFLTPGSLILLLLMIAGLFAAFLRFSQGLGATTNMNDVYPWGIWIFFDVMCGVALAAGGFTTAAVVYIFLGEKYHSLVRPAILTAFLGYIFVAVGLLADLALPWNIWHPIIHWPEHSAMFEVAWCVMLYLTVLGLEFLPAVFEKQKWGALYDIWSALTPWYIVVAMAFFVYAMSHSIPWTIITAVVYLILHFALHSRIKGKARAVPILLIIAGIIFSTCHQSSLGSLFLLMPDKLSPVWWTPMLPFLFFFSAVAVGFAMVIFEATISATGFNRPIESGPLAGFGNILMHLLWMYFVIRFIDLGMRDAIGEAVGGPYAGLFWLEMNVGVILPFLLLISGGLRKNSTVLFLASLLVVVGVVINRYNVCIGGMDMSLGGVREVGAAYFPSGIEFLITIGIVSALMFFYNIMVKSFPIFEALPESES